MSEHWHPGAVVGPAERRTRQPAPPTAPGKAALLCAAALFGAAIAIGEALLR